jgi:hypothetical protein
MECFEKLGQEQAGFRAGYSTLDHIFTHLTKKRQQYIPKYYCTRPLSSFKFSQLLSSKKKSLLVNLSRFISVILAATKSN